MSEMKWSLAAKRLDLGKGGSGSPKMEYVMVAVLGLIILVSLGLTLHSVFFGESGGPGAAPDGELHFQCTVPTCNHEFVKSGKDMEQLMPQALMPEMGLLQLDCPKCGAKSTCLMMNKCPNPKCHKYYLSAPTVANAKAMAEARAAAAAAGKDPKMAVPTFPPGSEQQPQDICPHCTTNRVEWYINYYKKKG